MIESTVSSTSCSGTSQLTSAQSRSQTASSHWKPVSSSVQTMAVESRDLAPSKPTAICAPSTTSPSR